MMNNSYKELGTTDIFRAADIYTQTRLYEDLV